MKFDQYPIAPTIKKNLEVLEFRRPTDIQYKAIPSILRGEDVLAIAQTGTGKTAAYVIPILNKVQERKHKRRSDGVVCLVMVPTHELAIQVKNVFQQLGKNTGVKTTAIFGGVSQDDQILNLKKGVDILIATPGRMFDLQSQGHLKLGWVEILVLDEADHMLDLGFIKDIRDLSERLPKKRQTLFFSATIDEKIKKIAYSLVREAIRIQISPKNPVAKNVSHGVSFVEMDDKRFFLERLIKEQANQKILVFVRTKVRAERVKKAMERVNIESLTIHGDKEQKDRNSVLNKFKSGEVKVLIATDVSARGVDIPGVQYVVNYDLPDQAENYVHRVGRTGRGKHRGNAVSFCSAGEKEMLDKIEAFLGDPIEILHVDRNEYQDTLDLSTSKNKNLKDLMKEIEFIEQKQRKQKKRKKKK